MKAFGEITLAMKREGALIDGPGGTGKTFMYIALLAFV